MTNASQRERNHSEELPGPGCRTPCRAPRCCRSMRESRGPVRSLGSIRALSSFGARVSTTTSWRRRTLRYSRSGACRRTPVDAGERTTPRTGSTPSSMVGGCPSARQVTPWERSQTVSDTPLRRVESSCAGMARTSLSSGPRLRPTWIRSARVSNSRGGTLAYLVRLRLRLSLAGPGFGLRRRAPFSRNSSVRLRRCVRRAVTHGSLPRMRQRSGPAPTSCAGTAAAKRRCPLSSMGNRSRDPRPRGQAAVGAKDVARMARGATGGRRNRRSVAAIGGRRFTRRLAPPFHGGTGGG